MSEASKQELKICKKCENKFSGNYCSNCGHPALLTRIDRQYITKEISGVLNFDKGILFTIRELILRPGSNIRKFILEDRNRLVKPVIFLIVCSFIYTIAQRLLHFEDGYVQIDTDKQNSALLKIVEWVQKNYGYANIYMGIFIGLWTKFLFKKERFNIYEILILIFFIMGIGMLIYAFFGIIESLTNLKVLHIGGVLGVMYSIWAIGSFFNKHKKLNYVKGFFSYFLGWITSVITFALIGVVIDLIFK